MLGRSFVAKTILSKQDSEYIHSARQCMHRTRCSWNKNCVSRRHNTWTDTTNYVVHVRFISNIKHNDTRRYCHGTVWCKAKISNFQKTLLQPLLAIPKYHYICWNRKKTVSEINNGAHLQTLCIYETCSKFVYLLQRQVYLPTIFYFTIQVTCGPLWQHATFILAPEKKMERRNKWKRKHKLYMCDSYFICSMFVFLRHVLK